MSIIRPPGRTLPPTREKLMTPDKKKSSALPAALVAALLFAGARAGIAKPPDVLERPAELQAKAENSVLLSVVRAGTRLVAVGEQGRIVVSNDHGATWTQVPAPTSVTLTAVHFAGALHGWAVGHSGVVLHSADGGMSWEKQLDGRQAAKLHADSVKGSDDATEEARARQRYARQLLSDGADKPFLDVFFESPDKGWIVGAYGIAFTTGDGGKQWKSIIADVANPRSRHLYSIKPVAGQRYIAGEQGILLLGEEGHRFSPIDSPYKGSYFGLLAGSDKALVLYGLRGNVFWSGNQGKDWKKVDVGQPITVTAGVRLDNGHLLLADESGRVLHSKDGGQTFKTIPVARPSYVTGIVQAADGGIVLAGARGMTRLATLTAQTDSR